MQMHLLHIACLAMFYKNVLPDEKKNKEMDCKLLPSKGLIMKTNSYQSEFLMNNHN